MKPTRKEKRCDHADNGRCRFMQIGNGVPAPCDGFDYPCPGYIRVEEEAEPADYTDAEMEAAEYAVCVCMGGSGHGPPVGRCSQCGRSRR